MQALTGLLGDVRDQNPEPRDWLDDPLADLSCSDKNRSPFGPTLGTIFARRGRWTSVAG